MFKGLMRKIRRAYQRNAYNTMHIHVTASPLHRNLLVFIRLIPRLKKCVTFPPHCLVPTAVMHIPVLTLNYPDVHITTLFGINWE